MTSLTPAALVLDRVEFAYQDSLCIRNISLQVGAGEWLALMGANGSGKSTVARLACGLLRPDQGRVKACSVAYVAQDPEANVVGETVADDVAFGPAQAGLSAAVTAERVRASLDAVQMEWARSRPMGSLSGGELQRVAVASALAVRAELLVLDEPTGHLPKEEAGRFWSVLSTAVSRDMAVLYVTHQPEEARMADYVALLACGRIAALGAPKNLLRKPALLDMLGVRPDLPEAVADLCERRGRPVGWPADQERLVHAVCSAFVT